MTTTIELSTSPSTGPLFAKAAIGALPVPGRPRELPDTELVLPGQVADRGHLTAYARVCGFALSDELPLTYPHVLGFGPALRLMTGRDFPFPLIGLVHVANRITRRRAIGADEPLDLRVWASGLAPHARGRQFVLSTEATVDGETVWREESTYLRREATAGSDGRTEERSDRDSAETAGAAQPPEPTARWRLPADIGRRYAAVSGDVNPIHLHRWTARPLGFRRAIAHGMYTTARCVAAMGPRLPAAVTVEMRFGKPVLLPATVEFSAAAGSSGSGLAESDSAGWDIAVHGRAGRSHLTGTVRPG